MTLCATLLLWLFATSGWSAEIGAFPDLNPSDPDALREASRVLEEELALAARPQAYVVIDLAVRAILLKARGLELHRIPIGDWSLIARSPLTGAYRLTSRPSVARRKLNPTDTVEQPPSSLADMPILFQVAFHPSLTLAVRPSASEHPLLWTFASSRMWWRHVRDWGHRWLGWFGDSSDQYLSLTLSVEQAQSFAWALVDGMPLVIRNATEK